MEYLDVMVVVEEHVQIVEEVAVIQHVEQVEEEIGGKKYGKTMV